MEQENITSTGTLPVHEHYIVAIGASAGGLEAIHEFFDNMPANGNFSFVIIQHLSPDYKSLLVELVSKHTHMKVYEAKHNAVIEPNCVYVIPNDKLLTIHEGRLQLTDKNFEKAPNTAIDTFLRSLAQDQGSKAIAVILSGTGTDGTKGIQSIQNAGGMVLVQDPLSAKFDGMPNSAIATGFADYILCPELMPEEIFNYIKERPIRIASEGKPDETLLPEVLKLIEKHCQYDFYNYKTPTILRRIGKRMTQLGYNKFQEYIDFLRDSSEECKILGKEFLIGVTKFFRDQAAYDIIKNEVLPNIIESKQDTDVFKVWVTACSTGEEAYSMAIMIDDYLQKINKSIEVKIFASDIDIESIEFASKGVYPANSVLDIEDHLVNRYFTREGNNVIIHPSLRKQIVFARHNILKDPPFIKNDLVSCRNMLIYMNNILQRKVLSTLQFSLNTGGYMFLGPSEIPASIKDGLEEVNSKWKLYRKLFDDNRYNPDRFPSTHSLRNQKDVRYFPSRDNSIARNLSEDFKNLLTEEYGYAAVYIDRNFEIKEAVGDFKKYLSLPDRISNLQILKMVPNDLSVALNTAIRKAIKENQKITLNNIRIRIKDSEKLINIFVRPAGKDGYMLVVFEESHDLPHIRPMPEFAPQNSSESVFYISELEEELKETRVNLQMAIESLETANEELQSSNEELLSANEELQSSNEELQSLNEELHTLNTEHQLRIKELIELNDDLNNYFRSSEIAQLFIDKDLRIRKFNPVANKMINLIESDIGRPIDHISTNFNNYNLLPDIQTTIEKDQIFEKEVQLANGSITLMRILPYLRQDKQIDGVVVTFVDISKVKQLDNIIKGVFNSSLSAILAFKSVRNNVKEIEDFICIAANEQSKKFLSGQNDFIGKYFRKDFPEFSSLRLFDPVFNVVLTGKPLNTEVQIDRNEKKEWFDILVNQMDDGFVLTITNITDRKIAEEKFRQNYHELMEAKESYRNLNSMLEQKVSERTLKLSQTEERFRLIASATNDAIWDWDLLNNHIWWSDSFYKRFGFEKNPEVGTNEFWLDHIHPDDRNRVNKNIQDAINSDSSWSTRYRFRNVKGEYFIILDRGKILKDANGKAYRMVGAMMDITEKERAEEQLSVKNEELQFLVEEFKFVTDFMPQIVWATQPDGYHDFFNKRWYDFTGISLEESRGKGWLSVIHSDDVEKALLNWNESLRSGNSYEVEYRMRNRSGNYRWFLVRAIPLKDNNKILKWFGTCTDIHDQKLASDILEQKVRERTDELQRANLELETSNNELLQFASVASHDLKEPLRKIHMFSNLVKDRYLENVSGANDYMNRIISASARMTRLINDLLTFTRLSVSTTFEVASLNTVVDEVMSDLELSISEKQATIEVGDLPKVEIITGQMRQVFQNIISNALKFSKKDEKPRISIQCELVNECSINGQKSDDGEFCRVTIKDNGIGFDNSYSDKIFTIFQRLHPREKYDGTGIGLAITRKIIEKHNGVISASGKENEGATFVIVMPLRQNVEEHVDIMANKN
jgi:PAS domain S-box